ncbi:hypothetical protein MAPG_12156 [Magnaporthiopsis poae ATCC 64411]|uniref:Uncharacterized protein n=1 Tax=Magnaporthiopsis poae (strain ATCC 64411 / 73-15) TaxID=644358 RepID=A0A0C4EGX8_MAGP6|nr:hypothetical protein MAPG_12156 [Magnaporthiopsis poae ATCC 64411]
MASSTHHTATITELPIDIQRIIFGQLPKRAILSCRLAGGCGKLGASPSSIDAFVLITEAEHLRCLVREVTCDTFMHVRGKKYQLPGQFLSVLPRLACFRGLRILNFRFSNHITWDGDKHVSDTSDSGSGEDSEDSDDDDSDSDRSIGFRERIRVRRELATETADFRFHVLNTVFQALMGTWIRVRSSWRR